mmetsp:Transcript_30792/g.96393  ORF Transcript_30792/g.96393 Transcript_30792/m.96393 type:complete len:211 (+) Transcript_30792:403-1035(+)
MPATRTGIPGPSSSGAGRLRRIRPRGLPLQEAELARAALRWPPAPPRRPPGRLALAARHASKVQASSQLLPGRRCHTDHLRSHAPRGIHKVARRDHRRDLALKLAAHALRDLHATASALRLHATWTRRCAPARGRRNGLQNVVCPSSTSSQALSGRCVRSARSLAGLPDTRLLLCPAHQCVHLPLLAVQALHRLAASRTARTGRIPGGRQ